MVRGRAAGPLDGNRTGKAMLTGSCRVDPIEDFAVLTDTNEVEFRRRLHIALGIGALYFRLSVGRYLYGQVECTAGIASPLTGDHCTHC